MAVESHRAPDPAVGAGHQQFATTHWSVVLAAGEGSSPAAQEALEELCRAYWYPLYAYVRRRGYTVEDAQDMTQEFFQRLLERKYIALADRERGRFRTFLLTALKRFLISEWRRTQAAKRSGGTTALWNGTEAEARYQAEPATDLTPEKVYDKRWALLILDRILTRLHQEALQAGKVELFEGLKSLLWGSQEPASYSDLSRKLRMSEGALRISAHRFRQRYRELLRAEIAPTVARPEEIDEEMRQLLLALS